LFQPNLLRKTLSAPGAVGFAFRASSLVVIAFALAGFDDRATAQSYSPPTPVEYYPRPEAPPAVNPSNQPQTFTSAPLPPLEAGREPTGITSALYGGASYTYRDGNGVLPKTYGKPYGPGHYARAPGPPSRPSLGADPILRPPADVGSGPASQDITGTVRDPADSTAESAGDRATVIAALPPEDQPEHGSAKELPPQLRRQLVDYATSEPAGTIIIDTPHTFLYLVRGYRKALRYGIGVGREGFTWSGSERVSRMSEWPDWQPPKEMIERQPYLPRFMAGGESNPLGARALYLGNTVYRIHGTNQPSTIGSFVSSGCIRLTNADIEDLYGRVSVGTRVVVSPGPAPASAPVQDPVVR
jgi:lipoprotein-anchoring transpeptidase ErfK/SrfK